MGLTPRSLHEILASCLGIEGALQATLDELYRREHRGAMDFATRYRQGPRGRPDASGPEVARYFVVTWRFVGDRIAPDLFRETKGRLDVASQTAGPD